MIKLPCHIVHHTNDVPHGYVSLTDIKAVLGHDEYLRVRNLMHAGEIESCRVVADVAGERFAPCYVNPHSMTLLQFVPRQWLRDRLLDVHKNLALTPAQERQQLVRLNNVSGASALIAQLNAEQLAEAAKKQALQELLAEEELRAKEEATAAIEAAKTATVVTPGIEKPSFAERLLAALEASTSTQVQMIAALNRLEKIWAD